MSLNINQVFGVLYLRHPFFGLDRACDWISPGPFNAWMRLTEESEHRERLPEREEENQNADFPAPELGQFLTKKIGLLGSYGSYRAVTTQKGRSARLGLPGRHHDMHESQRMPRAYLQRNAASRLPAACIMQHAPGHPWSPLADTSRWTVPAASGSDRHAGHEPDLSSTFESSFEAAGWDTDSDHLFMQTDESNWHSHDSYMDLDPELCPPGGAGFELEFGPPGQPFDSIVDIPPAPNTNIPVAGLSFASSASRALRICSKTKSRPRQ
ncbi:hypothetical protein GGX14DRAFT_406928 [Mycena pura]|uniref:Uncharacterized protein n=1 Tax=Mycena pura TaxID=153505 RepID=A0AAD6Y4X3_9AGAR|nr:hypothetical protein GGX14DRAFT_406928 [Mycena pura]